jgi:hypothetical protein
MTTKPTPDAASTDRTAVCHGAAETSEAELAMLVRRLASALRRANPDSKLPTMALDFLRRRRLQGSPPARVRLTSNRRGNYR